MRPWAVLIIAVVIVGYAVTVVNRKVVVVEKELAVVSDAVSTPISVIRYQNDPEEVKLLFVGDIMLGRYVEKLSKDNSDYAFMNVGTLLASSDATIANLEGPIPEVHRPTPSGSTRFSFANDVASTLLRNRIGIVSLANNHTYDQGQAGYDATTKTLDKAGVLYFGHPTRISTDDVFRVTIKNKQFVFIGLHAIDESTFSISKAIHMVKSIATNPDDIKIAYVHAGTEYELHSNAFQQRLYRGLIDAGVDIVIGAHPHVVQEVEEYKGKPIFYSLGNFIFDQYFSSDVQKGLAVQFTFNETGTQYEVIPLQSIRSQPYVLKGAKKEAFLTELSLR